MKDFSKESIRAFIRETGSKAELTPQADYNPAWGQAWNHKEPDNDYRTLRTSTRRYRTS